jgi:hypothetical protein
MKTAYLIVICEKKTNSIVSADIWSHPEWEASMTLSNFHTYVAYSVKAETFQKGIDEIRYHISNPSCRYHYLEKYLPGD